MQQNRRTRTTGRGSRRDLTDGRKVRGAALRVGRQNRFRTTKEVLTSRPAT
jgi:hypothetical protein